MNKLNNIQVKKTRKLNNLMFWVEIDIKFTYVVCWRVIGKDLLDILSPLVPQIIKFVSLTFQVIFIILWSFYFDY